MNGHKDRVKKWIRFLYRKFNSLILKVAYKLKWTYIPVLPISLDIEPINICNLKCTHCQINYWDKKKEILDVDRYLKIINQFPNLRYVKLQGIGEPFLNENLTYFIIINESRKIYSEVITNGTILPNEFIQNIERMKRASIKFSIDSAFKKNFENIRKGSNYDVVIGNLKKIIELRGKLCKPEISIWSVITKQNLFEITDLVNLANELKVDNITFQTYLNDWRNEKIAQHVIENRIYMAAGETSNKIYNAKCLAEKLKIDLRLATGSRYSITNICSWPFSRAFIAVNGDVVPCCELSNSSILKMGNIFENDFKEIWNSKNYQILRNRIYENKLNGYCKKCYNT